MKNYIIFLSLLFINLTANAQSDFNETIRSKWGFNLGFGISSNSTSISSLRLTTPGYIKFKEGGWVRLYADFIGKTLNSLGSTDEEAISDFTLGVQVDSPIMSEFFGFYSRFGVGTTSLPDNFYDGSVVILPISFGINFYSKTYQMRQWFDPVFGIEYRRPFEINYDSEKELVNNADSLFGGEFYFNIGLVF
jgi:hypothetical protein